MVKKTLTQDFITPGTTTWTVPAQVTSLTLDLVGGGRTGNSGSGYWSNYSWYDTRGLGGNAGSRTQTTIAVTPGQTITIIVGATDTDSSVAGSGFTTVTAAHGVGANSSSTGHYGAFLTVGGYPYTEISGSQGSASGGLGGAGWGAGGGGGYGKDPYGSAHPGGAGAAGYARIVWESQDFGGDGVLTKLVYKTPGTFTSTIPNGVSYVVVEIVGAGGGGAGATDSTGSSGRGGGRGGYVALGLTVTPGDEFDVVVGSHGVGGAARGANNGTAGAASSFGNETIGTFTCTGGAGGLAGLGFVGGGAALPGMLDDADAANGTNGAAAQQGYGDTQPGGTGGTHGGGQGGDAGSGSVSQWGQPGGNGGNYRGGGGGGGGAGGTWYGGKGGNGSDGYVAVTYTGWIVARPTYTGRIGFETPDGIIEAGLVAPADPVLRTNIVRIYDDGVKCIELVPIGHLHATALRIQTHEGMFSFRNYDDVVL